MATGGDPGRTAYPPRALATPTLANCGKGLPFQGSGSSRAAAASDPSAKLLADGSTTPGDTAKGAATVNARLPEWLTTEALVGLLAVALVGLLVLWLRLLWVKRELRLVRREAETEFAGWRQRNEKAIRRDAVQRSQAVTVGKVTEHLIPYLPEFDYNPKDARFIGSPVDFLVFDGLDEGDLRAIVFVEVKTGASTLSPREKRVREAVVDRRVRWRVMRGPG